MKEHEREGTTRTPETGMLSNTQKDAHGGENRRLAFVLCWPFVRAAVVDEKEKKANRNSTKLPPFFPLQKKKKKKAPEAKDNATKRKQTKRKQSKEDDREGVPRTFDVADGAIESLLHDTRTTCVLVH